MKELPKAYDPKQVEGRIYELWQESGAFTPEIKEGEKPFVIAIPPPNVTGSLHMGHALNNTIQDILIRRSRMKGVPTLWIPGTDHAGIATQNVVEKQLDKEGKSRNDLGREEFVKRVWQHVDEYGNIIIDQLKKMGCSCDWSRQRFTMDEGYIEAVNAAFKHYLDKGWIYQGERVINWCVRCQTALSDIELEHKQVEGKLWTIEYSATAQEKKPGEKIIYDAEIKVATTRPETMLGDTAVAVNPKDKRYSDWIGRKVLIPLINRSIPVIADESIDMKFGTGAVKVTPAHDIKDYEIWEKHKEEFEGPRKVINELGKITELGRQYAGMKVSEAREQILKDLGPDLIKTEDITHEVPHCYRCGRQVEQLISKQWFLKMSELIKPAIAAIEKDGVKITPTRWKKVYLDWMNNIRDWCISRQIWWGHKIPIEGTDDVLDTWFSSALWPFATLGWPKETPDLKYFYPTTILSTARDINMLWVVRMIFSGYEFMDKKPFDTVYVHPTVFNIEGKRMSKSLGTGIDPLELIDKYGTDSVRFGLTYINTGTQDIKFDENAILAGKKFANKLWNIARFTMLQTANSKLEASSSDHAPNPKSEIDKKILEKTTAIIKSTDENFDNFRFGQAAHELYDFCWHDFADVYLEEAKTQMENVEYRLNTTEILLYVLSTSLKLLHPIMPFISEEIWQTLQSENLVDEKLLIKAPWPKE